MTALAKLLRNRGGSWSRRFIELAGSVKDFPYPADPIVIKKRREFQSDKVSKATTSRGWTARQRRTLGS